MCHETPVEAHDLTWEKDAWPNLQCQKSKEVEKDLESGVAILMEWCGTFGLLSSNSAPFLTLSLTFLVCLRLPHNTSITCRKCKSKLRLQSLLIEIKLMVRLGTSVRYAKSRSI